MYVEKAMTAKRMSLEFPQQCNMTLKKIQKTATTTAI
jgi:hypothetical protein